MQARDQTDEPAESAMGSGEPPAPTKVDISLLTLALRENWPIPQATIDSMMAGISGVIEEPGMMERKPRLFLRCVQALAMLSQKNLKAVDAAVRAQAADELADRVVELERSRQRGEGVRRESEVPDRGVGEGGSR